MKTKQLEVTEEQRKNGILGISVNETEGTEAADAARAALSEDVESRIREMKVDAMALAAIDEEGWSPAAELAQIRR